MQCVENVIDKGKKMSIYWIDFFCDLFSKNTIFGPT